MDTNNFFYRVRNVDERAYIFHRERERQVDEHAYISIYIERERVRELLSP